MKRKNDGILKITGVVMSVAMLCSTILFSKRLTASVSEFTLLSLNIAKSVRQNKINVEEDAEAEAVITGFGNSFTLVSALDTSTPEDVEAIMQKAVSVYASLDKSGKIEETTFTKSSANSVYKNVAVNNKTETKKINVKNELNKKASLGKITKNEPYILIYHTHTTEGYELLDKGWYSDEYNSRTKDGDKTVVRVGEEIAERLEMSGFKVVHDKTIHDSSYNGAYSRSLKTVEKILKENPSIVITLDVHRDAIQYDSGTKCKPTAVINGKKAAQIMIITGAEEGDISDYSDWNKNLTFALKLQEKAEENFQGLMRPVFFCQRKYNMNVTPCSLLLEMGTDANTLDEAVYSGRLIGEALSELLEENMKNE